MNLETNRLIIRKPLLSDLDDLYVMRNDEVVLKYNCMNIVNYEQMKSDLENKTSEDNEFVLYHIEDDKVIGVINLEIDSIRYQVNSTMMSYWLNTNYTKKGYMSEALREMIRYLFEEKEYDVIAARVFTLNQPSNKLMTSLGFTLEGTLRHAVKGYKDIIYDDNLYCLLKSEYNTLKKK